MPYLIMGKYKNGPAEEIDFADSSNEAMRLLGEYQLSFGGVGNGWMLWVVVTA